MQVYYHIKEMSSCSCNSNDFAFGPDKFPKRLQNWTSYINEDSEASGTSDH